MQWIRRGGGWSDQSMGRTFWRVSHFWRNPSNSDLTNGVRTSLDLTFSSRVFPSLDLQVFLYARWKHIGLQFRAGLLPSSPISESDSKQATGCVRSTGSKSDSFIRQMKRNWKIISALPRMVHFFLRHLPVHDMKCSIIRAPFSVSEISNLFALSKPMVRSYCAYDFTHWQNCHEMKLHGLEQQMKMFTICWHQGVSNNDEWTHSSLLGSQRFHGCSLPGKERSAGDLQVFPRPHRNMGVTCVTDSP